VGKQFDTLLAFSAVISCFNEEKSLTELYGRLTATLSSMTDAYELIFIDDGSTDGTLGVLKGLHDKDKRVKIIHFRKNFGKSYALSQGFKYCTGTTVITLDADLQDLPEEIPKLLAHLDDGCDLVSGWKKKRKDPLGKKVASRIFNFCTSLITGINIHDFNCGLKAYRREVTEALTLYGEIYRFIPALAGWKGFRIGEVIVNHGSRKYGTSKFGTERLFKGFFDLLTIRFLTKYTQRPLHLFGGLGAGLAIVGFLIDTYLAVLWFSGQHIGHRPLLLLGTLLMIIGIQFIFFGLLGELIVFSSPKETNSVVKDTHGFNEH